MDPLEESSTSGCGSQSHSYRLYGNFWLPPPEDYLHDFAFQRLRQLEPHFRLSESPQDPIRRKQQQNPYDIQIEFRKFQTLESTSWDIPRPEEELVIPSARLDWPIAHHLHNPSFQTLTPLGGQTQDATSSCIWMVMQTSFEPGKTLIYDHCSRREEVDGISKYPQKVLELHETFLAGVRSNMSAKVEVLYGALVRDRMPHIADLEPLRLWGCYEDVVIYLEWEKLDTIPEKSFVRFLVPVYHPQAFLTPIETTEKHRQDKKLRIAHELASMSYLDHFNTDFYTTKLKATGILRQHYMKSEEIAKTAAKLLNQNLEKMARLKMYRSMDSLRLAWAQKDIEEFASTAVSKKYHMDPAKPTVVNVQCNLCGLPNKDYMPLWTIKDGKYVARRKKCRDYSCPGRLAIPQNSHMKSTSYAGCASLGCSVPQSSGLLAPQSPTSLQSGMTSFDSGQNKSLSALEPLVQSASPTSMEAVDELPPAIRNKISKGYNERERTNIPKKVTVTAREYWHGEQVTISQMGRVRFWVMRNHNTKDVRMEKVQFSAYGSYLSSRLPRILNISKGGIRLVDPTGKTLWQMPTKTIQKAGIAEFYKRELEAQRR